MFNVVRKKTQSSVLALSVTALLLVTTPAPAYVGAVIAATAAISGFISARASAKASRADAQARANEFAALLNKLDGIETAVGLVVDKLDYIEGELRLLAPRFVLNVRTEKAIDLIGAVQSASSILVNFRQYPSSSSLEEINRRLTSLLTVIDLDIRYFSRISLDGDLVSMAILATLQEVAAIGYHAQVIYFSAPKAREISNNAWVALHESGCLQKEATRLEEEYGLTSFSCSASVVKLDPVAYAPFVELLRRLVVTWTRMVNSDGPIYTDAANLLNNWWIRSDWTMEYIEMAGSEAAEPTTNWMFGPWSSEQGRVLSSLLSVDVRHAVASELFPEYFSAENQNLYLFGKALTGIAKPTAQVENLQRTQQSLCLIWIPYHIVNLQIEEILEGGALMMGVGRAADTWKISGDAIPLGASIFRGKGHISQSYGDTYVDYTPHISVGYRNRIDVQFSPLVSDEMMAGNTPLIKSFFDTDPMSYCAQEDRIFVAMEFAGLFDNFSFSGYADAFEAMQNWRPQMNPGRPDMFSLRYGTDGPLRELLEDISSAPVNRDTVELLRQMSSLMSFSAALDALQSVLTQLNQICPLLKNDQNESGTIHEISAGC